METKEVPGVEQALTLERSGSIESLSSFQDGFFHVQDLASQLCCQGAVSQAGRAGLRRMRRAGRKNLYYGGADGKPGRAFLL